MRYRTSLVLLVLLCTCVPALSQSSHRALRRGDQAYKDKDYAGAERAYGEAITEDNSAKGNYNLGNALYERGEFGEAAKRYEEAAGLADDPAVRSRAYRNLGDSQYRQENYQEAVEAYKQSLRLNPNDQETKYNLTKAIRQVQEQQQQDQQQPQDDNQQENQEDNKDQQQQQQQQAGQGGENGEQQQQDAEQNPEDADGEQQESKNENQTPGQRAANPNQPQMSQEEAERQLGIAAEEEKRTLSRLRQANREGCTGSKDW